MEEIYENKIIDLLVTEKKVFELTLVVRRLAELELVMKGLQANATTLLNTKNYLRGVQQSMAD